MAGVVRTIRKGQRVRLELWTGEIVEGTAQDTYNKPKEQCISVTVGTGTIMVEGWLCSKIWVKVS